MSEQNVVGWLHEIWSWADDHSVDGNVAKMSLRDVHRVTLAPEKLLAAMRQVGWIIDSADGISFPDFEAHMGESARKREEKALNKRLERLRRQVLDAENVAKMSPKCRQNVAPREEKRRVEKSREDEGNQEDRASSSCTPQKPDEIAGAISVISGKPESDKPTARDVFERWNRFVGERGRGKLAKARKFTESRQKKLRTRLRDPEWFPALKAAVELLPLVSSTDGDWQPTLDWLIRVDDNVYRLLEGAFDFRVESSAARKRLQHQQRRANLQREKQIEQEKRKCKQHAAKHRNVINDILPAMAGDSDQHDAKSMLFG